jgi:hypothetical protein
MFLKVLRYINKESYFQKFVQCLSYNTSLGWWTARGITLVPFTHDLQPLV